MMTSLLISSGAIPISTEEVRTAIGLITHDLDGLIAAAIAHHCADAEIIPTTWKEDGAVTRRQIEKGHRPIAIQTDPLGRRLVTYAPTQQQVETTKQRIAIWLLQQDDVHLAREREIAERLVTARISISTTPGRVK
jgi:hypothetical protein